MQTFSNTLGRCASRPLTPIAIETRWVRQHDGNLKKTRRTSLHECPYTAHDAPELAALAQTVLHMSIEIILMNVSFLRDGSSFRNIRKYDDRFARIE